MFIGFIVALVLAVTIVSCIFFYDVYQNKKFFDLGPSGSVTWEIAFDFTKVMWENEIRIFLGLPSTKEYKDLMYIFYGKPLVDAFSEEGFSE